MAWLTIGLAAANFVGSMIQGNQQREQADAANQTSKKQIKDRYERDLKEWSIGWLESQSNYAWNVANTEAQRYIDRTRQADYEASQSRIIDTALLNLELNTEALYDTYVTSEELRALEANLTFDQTQAEIGLRRDVGLDALGANAAESRLALQQSALASRQAIEKARLTEGNATGEIGERIAELLAEDRTGRAIENAKFSVGKDAAKRRRALEEADLSLDEAVETAKINTNAAIKKASIDSRSSQASLQNMQAVAGYMSSIKQRGEQANQTIRAKENEGKGIQEQILIAETLDTVQRDAQYLTALLKDADTKAGAAAKQGGSNSSRRVAIDAMQAFGRSYGELTAIQADRRRAMNNYNGEVVGETSSQLAQIASAIEGEANRIKYTKDIGDQQKQGFDIESRANELEKKVAEIALEKTTDLGMDVTKLEYRGRLNDLKLTRGGNLAQLRDTRQLGLQNLRGARGRAGNTAGVNISQARANIGQARDTNQLNLQTIKTRRGNTRREYRLNNDRLFDNFNKLTVPGFELARRQGEREYAALANSTYNEVKGAARPYRKAIIFDPLEPIAGLQPQKGVFTPVAKPSYGSILMNSFVAGAQGAAQGAYTDSSGNLAFR